MLKEKVYYSKDVPIKISMCAVEEYPIHYHQNDLELMVVMEGTVKLIEGYRTILLKKGDVFIVNEWELHGIYSTGEKNKLLFIQMNLTFFQNSETDFFYFFLIADTYYRGKKFDEPERKLKAALFKIVETALLKDENYESRLIEQCQSVLVFLKRNFQYFSVYEKSYFINQIDNKDNQIQATRVMELYRYMCENYTKKITLQEYANEKHINMYYLSHMITDSTGLSFQELLNFTRMEASEKLLLDTDKKISEIALDCGFSATRYYVKSFEKWYKTSPEEYRLIHRKRAEATINQTCYANQSILDMIEMETDSLITSETSLTTHYNKVLRIDVESGFRRNQLTRVHKLILDDFNLFSSPWLYEDLNNFRRHFEIYGRLSIGTGKSPNRELVEAITCIRQGTLDALLLDFDGKKEHDFCLETMAQLVDYCAVQDCGTAPQPIRVFFRRFSGGEKDSGGSSDCFQSKLHQINKEQHQIVFCELKSDKNLFAAGNPINDTIFCVPFLLHSLVNGESKTTQSISEERGLHMGFFSGNHALLTWNSIPKPTYYAYYLFSLLGDEVLSQEQDAIITRRGSDIQMLFFDYSQRNYSKVIKLSSIDQIMQFSEKKSTGKDYVVELKNLKSNYRSTCLTLTRNQCAFHKWFDLGMPNILSQQEEALLKKGLFPDITFETIREAEQLDLIINIPPFGAKMILLEKVYPQHARRAEAGAKK